MEYTSLEQVDYSLPKLNRSRWIATLSLTFFFSVFLYFPISMKIKGLIRSSLASLPGCAIAYEDLSFEFFLPKFVITDLNIPKSCLSPGPGGAPLVFPKTSLYIRGISFAPFGPHFKLETTMFKKPFESYITLGFGSMALNVKDIEVNLSDVREMLPQVKLAGTVKLNALVEVGQNGLQDLKANIFSKNLILPAQSISAFKLTTLNINDFLLKADMKEKNKLEVKEFILGDPDSPVRANFKGNITLNPRLIQSSQLDLKGEVAFSQAFLGKYSIVGLMMNSYDKKDEFYQIQLKGSLGNPIPSSPRK